MEPFFPLEGGGGGVMDRQSNGDELWNSCGTIATFACDPPQPEGNNTSGQLVRVLLNQRRGKGDVSGERRGGVVLEGGVY